MKWRKSLISLAICAVLLTCMTQAVFAAETNIALNPSGTGYPNPLESDPGWGGGSYPWDLVDGLRDYPGEWWHGLAFTGGSYDPGSAGVRQATVAFGADRTFYKVIMWHHTLSHIPAEMNLQYWDGSAWKSINFQRDLNLNYQPNAGYADTLTFEPITGSKVKYSFDNSKLNVEGNQIEHGWIYEFEVYESAAKYFGTVNIPSAIGENTPFDVSINMLQPASGILHVVSDKSGIIGGTSGTFSSGPLVLSCPGLPAGTHTILVELYDANTNQDYDTYTQQITIQSASIPEFPSVAIPVAAILGLVVIFGRRKI